MRILFLNRCYYPDVEATGQLLGELCTDLAREHEVTVIAGQPNFVRPRTGGLLYGREAHAGVTVWRTRNIRFRKKSFIGRVVGLASYLLLASAAALAVRRPDVLVVETDPPVLGALGVLLKWWHRCPLVYYLQDLFPEVGLAMGRLRPGPLTWLLRWTTQLGLRHADRVVVLGEDMRRRVLARGIDPAKIALVPNWVDTRALQPLAHSALRQAWGLDGQFVVMYSGNLGLSQNLEQVLEAAEALRGEPVRFVFVGEGAARPALEARVQERCLTNVQFQPYQPKERLAESLAAADLHLIPLRRGLGGCIVPSKLYGILAAGRPYLAAVDADSEVAEVTRAHGCGLLIEPDAAGPLVETLRSCLGRRAELEAMGRRGRELAERVYDRRLAVDRFAAVLRTAVAPEGAAPAADAALAPACKT